MDYVGSTKKQMWGMTENKEGGKERTYKRKTTDGMARVPKPYSRITVGRKKGSMGGTCTNSIFLLGWAGRIR